MFECGLNSCDDAANGIYMHGVRLKSTPFLVEKVLESLGIL
jgi:hypothetical protein